jgi:uncharacterized DUF497 family protein
MSPLSGFDWDAGNREKCERHGVSAAEIESLFDGTLAVHPDPEHSVAEQRFKAIGRTAAGRHVFVVFAIRQRSGKRLIRPISARYMHRKEIEHYEAEAARAAERRGG